MAGIELATSSFFREQALDHNKPDQFFEDPGMIQLYLPAPLMAILEMLGAEDHETGSAPRISKYKY